PRSFAV
nr:Chain C, PEPTIDE [Homo sapiens]